jgi:hypothetical protein
VKTLRRRTRLAPVALLPAAAFVVHQLRYMLAFGWNDGAELRMAVRSPGSEHCPATPSR